MIQITPQMRILLAIEPVDFRNHSACLIIPSSVAVVGGWRSNPEAFIVSDSE